MMGIPYRLLAQTTDGPVDKVIYLRTRRSGDAGKAMRAAKQEFYAHEFACGRAAKRFEAAEARAKALDAAGSLYEKAVDARDAAFDAIRTEGNAAMEAAEHLVRLALKENYGEETDSILDQLTDRDLRAMVTLIEMGELPKDFFGAGAAPAPLTTTDPSGE